MNVWVEHHECIGNGICADICPDLFVVRGGIAYVKHNGVELPAGQAAPVPDALIDDVIDVAERCPAECVFIE
ncbi:MAG: ferredoxin [Acidimicrobiia bacterium]